MSRSIDKLRLLLVTAPLIAIALSCGSEESKPSDDESPATTVHVLAEALPLQAQPVPGLDTPHIVSDWSFESELDGIEARQPHRIEDGILYLEQSEAPPTLAIPIGRDAHEVTAIEIRLAVRSGRSGRISWKAPGDSRPAAERDGWAVYEHGLSYREPMDAFQTVHVFLEDHADWRGPIDTLRVKLSDTPTPAAISSITLFRTRLRSRHTLEGGPLGRTRLRLGDTSIEIFSVPTPTDIPRELEVPSGQVQLRFAYGMTRPEWLREAAVRFRILARIDGRNEVLFEKVLRGDASQEPTWQWAEVDLTPYAGRQVTFRLQMTSVDTDRSVDALIGSLRVLVEGRRRSPNLLLICLDTLRADHLSLYGYERETSPHLDAFAARSLVFENVHSQVPTTLESHASLFTGLYPPQHGIGHDDPLGPFAPTLARILQKHGFTTAAFTDGGYTSDDFGLGAGFDRYEERYEHQEDLDAKIDRFLRWSEALPDVPTFAFLHTYAIHSPYRCEPEEAWRDFLPEYEGALSAPITSEQLLAMLGEEDELRPEDLAFITAVYDAGIRTVDAKIGRLLQRLEKDGALENTIVAIVSDHGEALGERRLLMHGYDLHREQTHVPWILYVPPPIAERAGIAPGRIAGFAELVDVAPTLLDILGIDPAQVLSSSVRGRSLIPRVKGRGEPKAMTLGFLPRLVGTGVSLRSRDRFFSDIRYAERFEVLSPKRRQSGRQLFDLTSDASALIDIADTAPRLLEAIEDRLQRRLDRLNAHRVDLSRGVVRSQALSDTLRDELRRLGYLGR